MPGRNAGFGLVRIVIECVLLHIQEYYTKAVVGESWVHECSLGAKEWGEVVYSRSPADPLSDGVLLPPTGIDVSTAIISARMSSTGCGSLAKPAQP